ncbi:MurR/RpiR family transcriptional regulator [Mesobacillus harenae]|uniref:MurR/RpiR family transcriptional regulator n=1 Tax=Mesobacillus harenae TaxID=2213203 RepID=UPI001580A12E|nr:MurR/RpiR family transcriptional regulator [Mesobacillus harenae]
MKRERESIRLIIKEKFSSLSPGQKKIAEFLVTHTEEAALKTAFQLGKRVGVSETTVIRLSYALGFKGFSEMQEAVREEWLDHQHNKPYGTYDAKPADTNKKYSQKTNPYLTVIEKEQLVLQELFNQLDFAEIEKAASQLMRADKVYIAGFGASYAAAHWLYYSLSQLRANVILAHPSSFLVEELCDLTDHSVAVIFSYPRYTHESIKLAELLKRQEVKLIAITNRHLSPIGRSADLTLTTEGSIDSDYHSIASVICLLELIIVGITKQNHEQICNRQETLESLYTETKRFLE